MATYSSYLQLESLLGLQRPVSDPEEHDELLFIVVHQIYELWFRVMLHELDDMGDALRANDTPRALARIDRSLTILKTLVGQVDVLETMTPTGFLSFRDRLDTASGFQSLQFREVEFSLGKKSERTLEAFSGRDRERLQRRYDSPTLWDAFVSYLGECGYSIDDAARHRNVTQPVAPNVSVQSVLVTIYKNDAAVTQVCEKLVDLDEGLQEWRYRHVKMVERTIGTRHGTGESAGAAYLRSTLFEPLFPDLWAIRTEL